VYCLLLPINTSMVAMNYGSRVSTKGWPVQDSGVALLNHLLHVRIAGHPAAQVGRKRATVLGKERLEVLGLIHGLAGIVSLLR
jgi:hypothetical protein